LAALTSSDMSLPQLPVMTLSAPAALIFETYGAKSFTLPTGCRSSPTISTSGRFCASIAFAALETPWPKA